MNSQLVCPYNNSALNDIADGHFSISYIRSDFSNMSIWTGRGVGVIFDNDMIYAARVGGKSPLLSVWYRDQGSQAGKNCGMQRHPAPSGFPDNWLSRRACFDTNRLMSNASAKQTFDTYADIVNEWPADFTEAYQTFRDHVPTACANKEVANCQTPLAEKHFDEMFVPMQKKCMDTGDPCGYCDQPGRCNPYNELILQSWEGLKLSEVPVMGYFYTDGEDKRIVRNAACNDQNQDVAIVKYDASKQPGGPFSCEVAVNTCP
jgi:hypothetical protein